MEGWGFAGRSLDTAASLVPLSGPAAGWITRCDTGGADQWRSNAQGMRVRCLDFLIDQAGRYQPCVPAADARHVARRTHETLLAPRARQDADRVRHAAGNGIF